MTEKGLRTSPERSLTFSSKTLQGLFLLFLTITCIYKISFHADFKGNSGVWFESLQSPHSPFSGGAPSWEIQKAIKTCPVLEEMGSGSGCAALGSLISHSHDTAFERNLLWRRKMEMKALLLKLVSFPFTTGTCKIVKLVNMFQVLKYIIALWGTNWNLSHDSMILLDSHLHFVHCIRIEHFCNHFFSMDEKKA